MFDNNVSAPALIGTSGDSLREAFGKALAAIADEFPKLVVLDADVAGGTGVHHFRKAHPERLIQFGIAEQNMMAAAGGLAAVGMLPVVTGFAVFLSRAFEQARLSISYCKRNAKIVASHPGLDVGPDGGSAQALEDIAAFRAIPGMTVISPADPYETALATRAILEFEGPVYMRTGRSAARRLFGDDHVFEIGKGEIIRHGHDVTLVACGVEVARALDAADLLIDAGISARVVNMATIKPIDIELLARCARETGAIVTAEDHNIHGGLGSAVAEAVAKVHPCPIEFVGVNDTFGTSGEPDELADHFAITAPFIAKSAERAVARKRGLQ
ncbi:MAG: transketolase family protein [Alphaproteobacteria bacterium]|nr:transketolase family protein [Alphaproteobacteria bacterium]MDE2629784.1 transketolase family protein [Alphaproteobacteria bacterium]